MVVGEYRGVPAADRARQSGQFGDVDLVAPIEEFGERDRGVLVVNSRSRSVSTSSNCSPSSSSTASRGTRTVREDRGQTGC